MRFLKTLTLFLCFIGISAADVVKPALVQISIYPDKTIKLVVDLNLEAWMSGIGTQYQNTTDAPNAAEYDELRTLVPNILEQRFKDFEAQFLNSVQLVINAQTQTLHLEDVKIDIVGYKKRPRKTILTYSAQPSQWAKTLSWRYTKAAGDSALRWQVFKADEYNWSPWQWLRNGESSGVIDINYPEPISTSTRFSQFIIIGFEHVIPLGWDHILFIIGMALSSLLWRRLLLLVSAFTLAHTLTLGLAMAGVVAISSRIVEPLIAFSITYVAIENLLIKQPIQRKSILVFLFGLVHGLGFASMLKNFEMQQGWFLITLVGFNIGVELAQIIIVLLVVLLLLMLKFLHINYRKFVIIPVSIIIACIGIVWGIDRI